MSLDRRIVLAGALALSACNRRADAQTAPVDLPPLKSVASFPVGACVQAAQLADPAFAALVAAQASQLTPEWEMKMEYNAADDGAFRFEAPDAIAAFARAHGQKLFGHTLVWYAQNPPAFERLDERRISFADAYRNYITAVVARYRGVACGWDVVNEAVAEDGNGWRDSLWSRRLGPLDHMVLAFRHAKAADPTVPLFLNDYNLESLPAKRTTFLKLAEALLKAGAPLSGLGTQTHVAADLAPGAIRAAIRDLASLGLPIHVSEMDVSIVRARGLLKDRGDLEARQARLYAEAAEAFSDLPARQRFAFTHWGLRDTDSWLRRENPADTPLMFDAEGRPKAAAAAWEQGLRS
ncbi:MAG TPA: endo-1,4-beta-xylanase [Phenylobacterium sp.]|nr:endo-1,4-beta-xylanase [Phenylobacterium sp.]